MTSPDEPVSILEIYTEPLAVLQLATPGPAGPAGPDGERGPAGPPGLYFQGFWGEDTDYDANDYVSYQRGTFVTTGLGEVGTPPLINGALSSGWYYLARPGENGQKGDPGDPGERGQDGERGPEGPPGVRFTDAWLSTRVYLPGDIVTFNGVLYISTATSEEFADPTNTNYWTAISYNGNVVPPSTASFRGLVPAGVAAEITHNLGTSYVRVTVRDRVTKEVVFPGVNVLDPNHIELTFGYITLNPVEGTFDVTVTSDGLADNV